MCNCLASPKYKITTQVFYSNEWRDINEYIFCKTCDRTVSIKDQEYAFYDFPKGTKFREFKEDITK